MKIIALTLVLGMYSAEATLSQVKLQMSDSVPQTRWIYNNKAKIKPAYRKLAQIKQEYAKGNFAACSKLASESIQQFKSIQPWLLLTASQCELAQQSKNKRTVVGRSRNLFQQIMNRKDWLLSGPYSTELRDILVELQILIVDWEINNRPQLASQSMGVLLDLEEWMSSAQKAKAYQAAAEHAFLQQNLVDAKAYVFKSLTEQENPKLKDKLKAIESALSRASPDVVVLTTPEIISAASLGVEEQKLVDRITLTLKNGDLLSAAKDGVELIEKYPGSMHADWASQRILESFLSISSQQDTDKYRALRYDFVNVMKNSTFERMYEWGIRLYKSGFYKESLVLFKEAYSKSKNIIFRAELNDYLACSYMHTGDLSEAEEIFLETTKKFAGSKESIDAYFYLGLIYYVKKSFSKAQAQFEKVLAQTQYKEHEIASRYWLWRASQKLDNSRAQQEAQILISKYPFSYYGLMAISEQNKGTIDFASLNKPIKSRHDMWLSPNEMESWRRVQILLEGGWYEEASLELSSLPMPNTPEGLALVGRYFAAAMDYPKALKMFNTAWDEKSELRSNVLLQAAFPKEFFETISGEAKNFKIDPNLVLSLIRQESSFNVRAVSSSGALGLMQIIPQTAQEISRELQIKNLAIPQTLFQPETNIKMGTYYISKLIRDFNNNVPFGLAAYNAGPMRVKRWMETAGVKPQSTSSPEYEVWIDMLPWAETRFYVKAILRNIIIYQLVDLKPIQVKDPVWPVSEG